VFGKKKKKTQKKKGKGKQIFRELSQGKLRGKRTFWPASLFVMTAKLKEKGK